MKLATEYAIDMDVILPPPDLGVLEQFSFKTITKQKIPRNKSPGADKIPVKILKDCLSHISAPMTDSLIIPSPQALFQTVGSQQKLFHSQRRATTN